nr:FUSC family protein [Massilia sp. Se16.2.3]
MMAVHLPFDTSHLRWTAQAIHALQERLAAMVPLLSAVEDRLRALRELGAPEASSRWHALLADITAWTGARRDATLATTPAALHGAIAALTPQPGRHADWPQLLELNVGARLRALVDLCVEARTLRGQIGEGADGRMPRLGRDLAGVKPQALHLDRGLAMVSALAAVIATLVWLRLLDPDRLAGWRRGADDGRRHVLFLRHPGRPGAFH